MLLRKTKYVATVRNFRQNKPPSADSLRLKFHLSLNNLDVEAREPPTQLTAGFGNGAQGTSKTTGSSSLGSKSSTSQQNENDDNQEDVGKAVSCSQLHHPFLHLPTTHTFTQAMAEQTWRKMHEGIRVALTTELQQFGMGVTFHRNKVELVVLLLH